MFLQIGIRPIRVRALLIEPLTVNNRPLLSFYITQNLVASLIFFAKIMVKPGYLCRF